MSLKGASVLQISTKLLCIIATLLGKVHTIFLDESTKILDFIKTSLLKIHLFFHEKTFLHTEFFMEFSECIFSLKYKHPQKNQNTDSGTEN